MIDSTITLAIIVSLCALVSAPITDLGTVYLCGVITDVT